MHIAIFFCTSQLFEPLTESFVASYDHTNSKYVTPTKYRSNRQGHSEFNAHYDARLLVYDAKILDCDISVFDCFVTEQNVI